MAGDIYIGTSSMDFYGRKERTFRSCENEFLQQTSECNLKEISIERKSARKADDRSSIISGTEIFAFRFTFAGKEEVHINARVRSTWRFAL